MSEKYKKEIEDILRKAGETGSVGPRRGFGRSIPRLIWFQLAESIGGKGWSLSPGRVMLIAVALLLTALIFGSFAPSLVGVLAWSGLILLIVGYAMFFIRPKRPEKTWRGRRLDDGEDSWWKRIRRKI
jgi:hypothetical protein